MTIYVEKAHSSEWSIQCQNYFQNTDNSKQNKSVVDYAIIRSVGGWYARIIAVKFFGFYFGEFLF